MGMVGAYMRVPAEERQTDIDKTWYGLYFLELKRVFKQAARHDEALITWVG